MTRKAQVPLRSLTGMSATLKGTDNGNGSSKCVQSRCNHSMPASVHEVVDDTPVATGRSLDDPDDGLDLLVTGFAVHAQCDG